MGPRELVLSIYNGVIRLIFKIFFESSWLHTFSSLLRKCLQCGGLLLEVSLSD